MPTPTRDERIEHLLEGLNAPQRAAVTHGEGPLLILAGAGSGKTRVLTHRIAYLVHTGIARHDEILAITFTNKAAGEMRDRVELLLGGRVRGMWIMTFHAACARMLRAEAPRLGYTRGFTIYDQADARRLTKRALDELGVDTKRFTPAAVHSQISDAKNRLRDAEAYRGLVGSFFEQTVADVYDLYERELHRANAMDFDDLLVRAVNVLELFQEVRDRYGTSFRHVLVDEYQDTNHAQYRLLALLTSEHRNLAVVGDDAQCLLAGTAVTMADGSTKPIQEVAAGDEVLSCHGSGDFRPARVTRTYASHASMGIAITTRSGRRIVSTPEHTHFAGHEIGLTQQRCDGRRRQVTVTLCGGRPGRTPMHLVAVGGRDREAAGALRRAGLSVRPAKAGSASWRYESCFREFGDAAAVVRRIRAALPVDVRLLARLGDASAVGGRNALPFIPAASVRPGMVMFTEGGGYDVVETVQRVPLEATVHDIDVEHTHNFVANGLVTHNSIYGFRGADIRNILDFEDDHPDAEVVRLEQNYRSTQTILSAANAVIAHNRAQKPKSLWTDLGEGDPIRIRELDDEHAEARFVVGEVERLLDEGTGRAEIAVFYRTNAQSRVLQDTLVRREIAYQVVGGTKFYDRAEVKDALAYLIVLANPQDGGSFTRIANVPRRGIGQTSLSRVLGHAATLGVPVWEAAADPASVPGLGAAARKAFGRFMQTMAALRERAEQQVPVGDLLEAVLHETGYLDALRAERTIEAQGRIENLQELVEVAREFDATAGADATQDGGLEAFLQQVSLVADADTRSDDEGLVTLMTLHNAKGLEYPVVFMIGCEEGVFPHSRALDEGGLEEERRLMYVGVTRAMHDLYLTYARRRSVFGAQQYGLRSRFLDELPRELTDGEDEPVPGAGARRPMSWGSSRAAEPAVDLRTGDDVVHPAFGDGVVTGVEPGGIVVVRFAGDGSERKLMAEYAPITKR